jgi:hypothetical protein
LDFGGVLVLGIIWLLFNLIGQGKGRPRPTPQPRPPGSPDPTQQEGSRLERMLRELERSLEDSAARQEGHPALLPVPTTADDEDVEERDSLENPERVVSLETDVPRRVRAEYDQDTEAEAIVQRRIEAARARDRALGKADHKAFDAKIRQQVADHTAVRRYTSAQLRDAVVWREILGPPVSERPSP